MKKKHLNQSREDELLITEDEPLSGELLQGTLLRGIGSFYYVLDQNGIEYTLRCKKKFRRMHISPLAGDEVLFSPGSGEEHGWLEEILPRKTECLRPPVSNVTLLLIVIAPVPEPDLLLVDRLLIQSEMQGMQSLIVVNKSELDPELSKRIREQYKAAGIPVHAVSAREQEGLELLKDAMHGHLCCMSGQSGVGKSTLLNALLGLQLETGSISEKIERGKNTTRHAELLISGDIKVMDTAGFSLLETGRDMDPVLLEDYYPDFVPYKGKCRFDPCYHDREPGCAVNAAAASGDLDADRLNRYRLLLSEVRQTWRNRYD